jgi:DNA-binding beta-propeller fold protein YncE
MIHADGSNESRLEDAGLQPGVWSRDGAQMAVGLLVDEQSQPSFADTAWVRPALTNTDLSDLEVLDAYPGRKMNLLPLGWSSDQSRIFVMSGYDPPDIKDVGLFSVRAADGGDLTSILPSDPGDTTSGRAGESCARPDGVHVSPDGSKLLVNRMSADDCGQVLVFNADGTGEIKLNPAGVLASEFEPSDFLERGGISECWSPDGSQITFTGYVIDADSTALYVIQPDGEGRRQIVPTEVGAVTATWSPDGAWIAFTSRLRSQPQVWVVKPDGSGMAKLTDGADGSTSVMPVWSPDSSRLLFERKLGSSVTLWTVNVDGSGAIQLSPTPVSNDYFGPYAWWPAPAE